MPRIGALTSAAVRRLERAGVPEPRVDAELLLAELLGCGRGTLWLRRDEALDDGVEERFLGLLERRLRREPLQHILGYQEFRGLRIEVDGRALIPRPETEALVDAALAAGLPAGARVADLGTGSGCLAVALAVERPDLRVEALERSPAALALARANAALHGVAERVAFVEGDLAAPPAAWSAALDAVLSNPPYVARADWERLAPEVRDHDPREALVAGETGLEVYRRLAPAAGGLLRDAAPLILELGYGQRHDVAEIVTAAGFETPEVLDDLNGVPRVLVARRKR
jgi:release factor glutamine methyltransferase